LLARAWFRSPENRLLQRVLKALSISIDETFSGDFKNLPSFKGGRNPFVTLAEKFRFAINPTLGDFAGGYVNSVGDLNNPKHKYSGYRNVIKFNPLNSISGSFEVKVPFAPDGKSRSAKSLCGQRSIFDFSRVERQWCSRG
jgi:hypothetical protein